MSTDDDANQFMTEADEQLWGEKLRWAFAKCSPNPKRKGCPDPKLIRDLAFHKKIGNRQVFEQVTEHMAKCSECVSDALRYVDEYKKQREEK
jgi:hypothetical protein